MPYFDYLLLVAIAGSALYGLMAWTLIGAFAAPYKARDAARTTKRRLRLMRAYKAR